MLLGVKHGLTVVRPLEVAGHVLDPVRKGLAGFRIQKIQVVESSPPRVDAVCSNSVVGADLEPTHGKIVGVTGQLVDVQHYFLIRIQRALLAGVDRIFTALDIAVVIEVIAAPVWRRLLILLDARLDFIEQDFLHALHRCHHLFGVGVLRVQICNNIRVVPLFQPVIIIDANIAVKFEAGRLSLWHRGSGLLFGTSSNKHRHKQ